jgi:hypothetical protein
MTDEKRGRQPDFKGKVAVAIWENTSKEGKKYLTIDLGGMRITCFKNEVSETKLVEERI